jgi:hypothetical protein
MSELDRETGTCKKQLMGWPTFFDRGDRRCGKSEKRRYKWWKGAPVSITSPTLVSVAWIRGGRSWVVAAGCIVTVLGFSVTNVRSLSREVSSSPSLWNVITLIVGVLICTVPHLLSAFSIRVLTRSKMRSEERDTRGVRVQCFPK